MRAYSEKRLSHFGFWIIQQIRHSVLSLKELLRKFPLRNLSFRMVVPERPESGLQHHIYFLVVGAAFLISALLVFYNLLIAENTFGFAMGMTAMICLLIFFYLPRHISISSLSQVLIVIMLAIITIATSNLGGLGPGNLMLFVSAFCLIMVLLPSRLSFYYSALAWMCFFGVMLYELKHPEIRVDLTNHQAILNSNIMVVVIMMVTFLGIYTITNSYFKLRVQNSLIIDELKKKNDLIESSCEFRKKLLAAISHDVKSPVQSLVSIIELLKADVASEKDMNEYIPKLANKVKSVSTSIDDILNWSHSQIAEFDSPDELINTRAVLSELTEELTVQLEDKSIDIVDDLNDVEFLSKKSMIKSILRNLLTNAIKFSYPEGSVEVKSRQSEGFIILSVRDWGTGMTDEVINNLYAQRSNSRLGTSGEKGSGLGLLLTRDLVKKLGGELLVESQIGKGTMFTCTLPL